MSAQHEFFPAAMSVLLLSVLHVARCTLHVVIVAAVAVYVAVARFVARFLFMLFFAFNLSPFASRAATATTLQAACLLPSCYSPPSHSYDSASASPTEPEMSLFPAVFQLLATPHYKCQAHLAAAVARRHTLCPGYATGLFGSLGWFAI